MKSKNYLVKIMKLLLLMVLFTQVIPAIAFCPYPEERVQTLFTRSDIAFVGTVVSYRGFDENGKEVKEGGDFSPFGGPQEIYFKLKVIQIYRGAKTKFIEVCENNDTGRMGLKPGDTYLIFIQKDEDGKLKGYCHDATDSKDKSYKKKIKELEMVIENIKKGSDGDILGFVGESEGQGAKGVAGIHFLVTGNGISKKVVSDKDGWFHVRVPQGHYKVKPIEPNRDIKATIYSSDDPDDVDVRTAGGGELGFVDEATN